MINRGIFKANDIRGVTEGSDPEWDAAGAHAIGAAVVEVSSTPDGLHAVDTMRSNAARRRTRESLREGVIASGR